MKTKVDIDLHLTLFSKIKELLKLGVLTEEPVYREGFGWGHKLKYNGHETHLFSAVSGLKSKFCVGQEGTWLDVVDVLIDKQTKELIAVAKS